MSACPLACNKDLVTAVFHGHTSLPSGASGSTGRGKHNCLFVRYVCYDIHLFHV